MPKTSPPISTPIKKSSKIRSKGITPIKTPTGTGRFVGNNHRMTYKQYALALIANFLASTGFDEENMRSLVYGIEYIIDGVHYFKIGSADILQTIDTSLGLKTGRICSSLKTLSQHFEKVRIEKIHFVIKDDPSRDLFKLLIESNLLKNTKSYFVNPGEEKGHEMKEFRKMECINDCTTFAIKMINVLDLKGAFTQ
jgi:hypothetical protein